jgi:hypothetical protein
MFRTTVAILLTVAACAPAAAAVDIGMRARTCWNLLPSDFGMGGNVEMIVSTERGLVKNIAVESYWPDDARGYAVAEAAAKAVQQCAPYEIDDGDHQVMMNVLTPGEAESPVSIPLPGTQ